MELSLDASPRVADWNNLETDEFVETTDVGGITGLDRRVAAHEAEPDVLDIATTTANVVEDTGNSVAMGVLGPAEDRVYDFRSMFGRGPVVDRHTDLSWHLSLQNTGDPDGEVFDDYALVWDIFDSPR
jgi:hypothetical protein